MPGLTPRLPDPPALVVRNLLVQLNIGINIPPSKSWPATATSEADSPDDVVTVYDTTPTRDGVDQLTGGVYYNYGIQLRIRAADYPSGWSKANQICATLQPLSATQVTIGSNVYEIDGIKGMGGVISLGKERGATRRSLFTINFTTPVRLVSSN